MRKTKVLNENEENKKNKEKERKKVEERRLRESDTHNTYLRKHEQSKTVSNQSNELVKMMT